MSAPAAEVKKDEGSNFLRQEITNDLAKWKAEGKEVTIRTRFPPEPNGFLHLGHAKSIVNNFGLQKEFGGKFNMRFDDTNPEKEDTQYVNSILYDVRWLGAEWDGEVHYTSDYFGQLYEWALHLIDTGFAYVDSQTKEEIKLNRGGGPEGKPGVNSRFRDRTPEENRDLFERMKKGEFEEGKHVLRAKIDMNHGNPNMRDPLLYRIMKKAHHRTGEDWVIYPIYDYAHGQSDAVEEITHSICTLEFETHRPLYNWFLDHLPIKANPRPRQIEFARLALSHSIMSKRKILTLVDEKIVNGWDDPRLATLAGLRRRGVTKRAIHDFVNKVGITKSNSTTSPDLLDFCINQDLDAHAPRRMGVVSPVKLVVTNLPEGEEHAFDASSHPNADKGMPSRSVTLTRDLWVEAEDFEENPPKGYQRLTPGAFVRLRFACIVKCTGCTKDEAGKVTEIQAEWDPASKGGVVPEGAAKPKGTIHWASATRSIPITYNLYSPLFTVATPEEGGCDAESLRKVVNPNSLVVAKGWGEPELANMKVHGEGFDRDAVQLERKGYFTVDPDTKEGDLVLNLTVPLKSSYDPNASAKPAGKKGGKKGPAQKAPEPELPSTVDLRVGKVVEVSAHPDADSLYVEKIDIGEAEPRTIVSGLVRHISVEEFTGKMIMVWANMKPSKLRGVVSSGMVMCASKDGEVKLVSPPEGSVAGDLVSIGDYPRTPLEANNKKQVDNVKAGLRADDSGAVVFGEGAHPLKTEKGPITSSIPACPVQ